MPRRRRNSDLAALRHAVSGGVLSLADAARELDLTHREAMRRLAALRSEGKIQRVARGLYLLEPQGGWPEPSDSAEPTDSTRELASWLFWPCYIGGWSAARHWGLSAGDDDATFVVTAGRVRRTRVHRAGRSFHVVRVPEEYLEGPGVDELEAGPASIASPERTLVDALNHPAWLGGAGHVANALSDHSIFGSWNEDRLFDVMEALLTGAGIKRLDAFIAHRDLIRYIPLRHDVWDRRTKGIVDLGPGEGSGGRVDYPSGVRINVALDPEEEDEPVASD